jgi:uncharacterized protein (TIGR02246 family)
MTRDQSKGTAEPLTEIVALQWLYQQLLDSWNQRNADAFARLFDDDGYVVGFDGSPMHGREEIATTLRHIFDDHPTGVYVGKAREVQLLTPDVAIVRAVAGMVPPGQTDLNPAVNTMQSLVATRQDARWQIALYQNTPAQFHGRPELSEQLTAELRQLL